MCMLPWGTLKTACACICCAQELTDVYVCARVRVCRVCVCVCERECVCVFVFDRT